MFKKVFIVGMSLSFLGTSNIAYAEREEDQTANEKTTIEMQISDIQSIPSSEVLQVENEYGTYLMIKINSSDEKEVRHDSVVENPYKHQLTDDEFEIAKRMIELEMEQTGYILDTFHEKNGVGGYIRRLVSEEFYTKDDTMRSHQSKSQQLLDYMDMTYNREEKRERDSSTVRYTKEDDNSEKSLKDLIMGNIVGLPTAIKNQTKKTKMQITELYKMYFAE